MYCVVFCCSMQYCAVFFMYSVVVCCSMQYFDVLCCICCVLLSLEQHHSLIVQSSTDITFTGSAAVQVVTQAPVFRLRTTGQREDGRTDRTKRGHPLHPLIPHWFSAVYSSQLTSVSFRSFRCFPLLSAVGSEITWQYLLSLHFRLEQTLS